MYVGRLCMYVGMVCMYVGRLCMYVGMLCMNVCMVCPMNAIDMLQMLHPRVPHLAWLCHCIGLGYVVNSNTVASFPGPRM